MAVDSVKNGVTMKDIDIKSVIIGALLATTVFFGMGATGKDDKDKWDNEQVWETVFDGVAPLEETVINGKTIFVFRSKGWEPHGRSWRRRIK